MRNEKALARSGQAAGTVQAARAVTWGFVSVIVLALAGPVRAEDHGTTLAVALDPGAKSATATLDTVLREVAGQTTRIEAVDLAEIARGAQARERRRVAARAHQALQSGKLAYQNLEFDKAVEHFKEAVSLWEKSNLGTEMPGLLATYAMLAATHYFSGDVRNARAQLTRLLSLRTDYVFDTEVYSPDILELAEKIRASVAKDHGYSLEVLVSPIPARVYVDGVFRGLSPQELTDLAPGPHYVTVDAPGYALEQGIYKAGPGAMAQIGLSPAAEAATLSAHEKALRKGFSTGEVSAPAAALARWSGVDEVLVAGVTSSGRRKVRVVAVRVAKDGHILAHTRIDLDLKEQGALGQAAGDLKSLYAQDLPRGPGGAPVARPIEAKAPLGARTWSTIAFGVGGAALASGTIFAFQARSAARDAKAIPQVEREAIASAVGRARARAAVADTFFGLSLAALGAGLYLIMPAIDTGGGGIDQGEEDPFAVAPIVIPGGGGVAVAGRF